MNIYLKSGTILYKLIKLEYRCEEGSLNGEEPFKNNRCYLP